MVLLILADLHSLGFLSIMKCDSESTFFNRSIKLQKFNKILVYLSRIIWISMKLCFWSIFRICFWGFYWKHPRGECNCDRFLNDRIDCPSFPLMKETKPRSDGLQNIREGCRFSIDELENASSSNFYFWSECSPKSHSRQGQPVIVAAKITVCLESSASNRWSIDKGHLKRTSVDRFDRLNANRMVSPNRNQNSKPNDNEQLNSKMSSRLARVFRVHSRKLAFCLHSFDGTPHRTMFVNLWR